MKSLSTLLAIPAVAICALFASSALPGGQAQAGCHPETFHDERAEGGVCCFSDHFHTGTSNNERSRAAAVREAIGSWEDFTAFEYGNDYGSWSLAHSKSVSCSGGGGSWGCTVEARACHRD